MSISSMPWVKLYTEILDDCKVGQLSDLLKWRFVSLICVAGECDSNGCLVSGTGAMSVQAIAWRLRITAEALEKDLAELSSAGLVILEDGIWTVTNFAKRQGRAQYEKREQWRESKSQDREEFQQDSKRNPAGIQKGADKDSNAREEKSREEKKKTKREGADAPPPRPPAVDVYRSKANTFPVKALWPEIAEVVGDSPENLTRWGDVVYAYVRCGWNRSNVGAMLDWYRRGELPHTGNGQMRNARTENGMTPAQQAILISQQHDQERASGKRD